MEQEKLVMEFDGDVMITDPCYFVGDQDWYISEYGERLDLIGLNNCICRDTIYGDWFCTVYDVNSDAEIGTFTADSGMIGVFDVDEVLKYNPDFDFSDDKEWMQWIVTVIKNFKGKISIIEDLDEDGEPYVMIAWEGVNSITGEDSSFIGYQTAL